MKKVLIIVVMGLALLVAVSGVAFAWENEVEMYLDFYLWIEEMPASEKSELAMQLRPILVDYYGQQGLPVGQYCDDDVVLFDARLAHEVARIAYFSFPTFKQIYAALKFKDAVDKMFLLGEASL